MVLSNWVCFKRWLETESPRQEKEKTQQRHDWFLSSCPLARPQTGQLGTLPTADQQTCHGCRGLSYCNYRGTRKLPKQWFQHCCWHVSGLLVFRPSSFLVGCKKAALRYFGLDRCCGWQVGLAKCDSGHPCHDLQPFEALAWLGPQARCRILQTFWLGGEPPNQNRQTKSKKSGYQLNSNLSNLEDLGP